MSNEATKLVDTKTDIPQPQDSADVPEPIRGLSQDEINQRYLELHKRVGSQGNEIKRLTDELKSAATPKQSVDEADFFDNPEKVVDQRVDAKIAPLVAENFKARLTNERPHWQATVADDDFVDWVKTSKVRLRILSAADQGDLDCAVELLDMWDQHNGVPPEEAARREAVAVNQDRKLRAASSETGTAKRSSGKVYSRRWIQHLKATDPAGYRTQLPEIKKAYETGRVTD